GTELITLSKEGISSSSSSSLSHIATLGGIVGESLSSLLKENIFGTPSEYLQAISNALLLQLRNERKEVHNKPRELVPPSAGTRPPSLTQVEHSLSENAFRHSVSMSMCTRHYPLVLNSLKPSQNSSAGLAIEYTILLKNELIILPFNSFCKLRILL
ncbi:5247_t:CDS:2, partial [Acaulospora morrowiae]